MYNKVGSALDHMLEIVSRPWQSQGSLYKHYLFILTVFLPWLYCEAWGDFLESIPLVTWGRINISLLFLHAASKTFNYFRYIVIVIKKLTHQAPRGPLDHQVDACLHMTSEMYI